MNKTPNQRWEDGDEHDAKSIALFKFISDTDFAQCGDSFCFKSGGDGDNGETLMFILDCWFSAQNPSPQADQSDELTKLKGEAKVLRDLLGLALGVVDSAEAEDSEEAEMLMQLYNKINAALRGAA